MLILVLCANSFDCFCLCVAGNNKMPHKSPNPTSPNHSISFCMFLQSQGSCVLFIFRKRKTILGWFDTAYIWHNRNYCFSLLIQIGETCSGSSNRACDAGLTCQTCPVSGNTRPRCARIQPLNPTSKVVFVFFCFLIIILQIKIFFFRYKVNIDIEFLLCSCMWVWFWLGEGIAI